jgi:hypothetical protein
MKRCEYGPWSTTMVGLRQGVYLSYSQISALPEKNNPILHQQLGPYSQKLIFFFTGQWAQ